MRVTDPGLGVNAYRTERADSAAGATVDGVTVAAIFEAAPADCYPFIVKIDIEGAEAEVFACDIDWIAQTPLLIIELHDWLLPRQAISRSFLRAIAGLDRDFVHIGESIFSIDNQI